MIELDLDTLRKQLSGIDKSIKALADPKDAKGIWRKATRAMAKVVLPTAKALAPKRTGTMANNLKVKAMPRSRKYVGTSVRLHPSGDQFYGSFQEWGWKPRGRKTGKGFYSKAAKEEHRQRGRKVKGKFFLKAAAIQKEPAALQAFNTAASAELDKVWGRNG